MTTPLRHILTGLLLSLAVLSGAAAAPRELKLTADRLDYDEAHRRVRLVGNVRLESANAVLTAPYAEYFTDSQVAELSGGVKVETSDSTVIATRMTVYYPQRRGVMAGNVRMLTRRGPGQSGLPTTLLAAQLDYSWEAGLGTATGGIKVWQGERRAYADRADYRRDEQVIDLAGNVRYEQGPEDWLTADRARVDLDGETITATGGVFARILVDEPEKRETPPQPAPSPPAMEPELPLESVPSAPPVLLPGLDAPESK